jgi:hypothetical protein
MSADDFEPLKVIGRGAFGEVNQIIKISVILSDDLGSSCAKT